ncbi:hypothetical protein AV530_008828 [Patagioenas fasciata monilis]|uniref:Uncharacterized protein n=1 Tax=Patagioenas fasciata monilis TaxID=372326 RepID=A0A1V4JTW8_PATFA|nr:hypothetical protein AV530_008828 [Patagioenas fasciata monilis]
MSSSELQEVCNTCLLIMEAKSTLPPGTKGRWTILTAPTKEHMDVVEEAPAEIGWLLESVFGMRVTPGQHQHAVQCASLQLETLMNSMHNIA